MRTPFVDVTPSDRSGVQQPAGGVKDRRGPIIVDRKVEAGPVTVLDPHVFTSAVATAPKKGDCFVRIDADLLDQDPVWFQHGFAPPGPPPGEPCSAARSRRHMRASKRVSDASTNRPVVATSV